MKMPPQIRTADVRELLRLLGELGELRRDRVAWRRHLLARLCQLTDAHCGMASVTQGLQPGETPYVALVVEHNFPPTPARDAYLRMIFDSLQTDPLRAALTRELRAHPGKVITHLREELVPDADWYAHPQVATARRSVNIDRTVVSACPACEGAAMMLAVYRPWKRGKPFTERERTLLDLCNGALLPFYRAEVAGQPGSSGLSPRLNQTLTYLLAGRSEKEIADAMKLSRHTIHDYIKLIYKHYNVSSRSELLARFIT